ncbi:hypothetical protein [Bacteroides clarus]|uniref:hypothetical protein n=1 Tax=Bacteroides clarus TaxID=626929 RepID=UPI00248D7CF6|nr:hypothetical protein [Bacteroides clarus]
MAYTIEELQDAYNRLRTYVFYDNTDLLLRKQIVEFETNRTKDINSMFGFSPEPYKLRDIFTVGKKIPITEKLKVLTDMLNTYHNSTESKDFFNYLFKKISIRFYPKKINSKTDLPDHFISNERVLKQYAVSRITAFIHAPIEFHILSVLWIIKKGVSIDSALGSNCLGNRLLLNQENTSIVQGSGLFKPYYKQYQRWRDTSVKVAKEMLEDKRDVLFINLDVKDYFHSARIDSKVLYDENKRYPKELDAYYNLNRLLLKLHLNYTELVAKEYQSPNNFYEQLKKKDNGELDEFILPIGLLSSYVLANNYLKAFDEDVMSKVKPTYYGRYVDDIIMVVPIYKKGILDKTSSDNIIAELLSPVIQSDVEDSKSANFADGKLRLKNFDSLFCQADKSLFYFFKHDESTLVIDKLKKELDERTSEFRDIPLSADEDSSFETCAYHLLYDGSEGKIKTLKDYKENRYGLTLYLTNKIFSSLRQKDKLSKEDAFKILTLFKGLNCIEYYRMWEKIFTLFLINNNAKEYVEFYFHCIDQIDKIESIDSSKTVENTNVEYASIRDTLIEYLDCAHELSLALNPQFISKTRGVSRHFEFKANELKLSSRTLFFSNFEPTNPQSFWITRFREANFIRHQYVSQPLLNYTKEAKNNTSLIRLSIDHSKYELDDDLLKNSPRPVKFWECCIAYSYRELANSETGKGILSIFEKVKGEDIPNNRKEETPKEYQIYLDTVLETYKKANRNHIADYILSGDDYKHNFYKSKVRYDDHLCRTELFVNCSKIIKKPKIGFGNTEVKEQNIISSLRGEPNISSDRYNKIATILNRAREEDVDVLLFPESFIPINLLSSLSRYAEKNRTMIITGLEHVKINNLAFNFIVTVIPVETNGVMDSIVLFRLKNHYSPHEELVLHGNHIGVPIPSPYRYDIIVWNNIYLSSYYCFELANVTHRSLFKSKIDLMVAIEYNKDTHYFSNIVEASSRDLHVYVAQANTSQYGDSRLTQPSEYANKDILRLKGGINDTILVAQIDIPKLREFQRKTYALTMNNKEFKPLPPDHNLADVLKRIRNESVL